MILYSYFRSSAAYRVRIALNLKNIDYQIKPIHLLQDGGEQHQPEYHHLNPSELVPLLIHDDITISQSLLIIDYLQDLKASPSIYPKTKAQKLLCKELAFSIACDIHPINNLRVLNHLKGEYNLNKAQIKSWNQHWIRLGFNALEERLSKNNTMAKKIKFCFGKSPTLADICLIPQVYNGLRHGLDMNQYPILNGIYQHCITLDAFIKAAPESQPDYPA